MFGDCKMNKSNTRVGQREGQQREGQLHVQINVKVHSVNGTSRSRQHTHGLSSPGRTPALQRMPMYVSSTAGTIRRFCIGIFYASSNDFEDLNAFLGLLFFPWTHQAIVLDEPGPSAIRLANLPLCMRELWAWKRQFGLLWCMTSASKPTK